MRHAFSLQMAKFRTVAKLTPQIRDQQETRGSGHSPGCHQRRRDGKPERHDFDERQPRHSEAEEDDRPADVQDELRREPAQGRHAGKPAPPPHQPAGDGHGGVQDGPDRPEDPVRGAPRRFGERDVPASDRGHGEQRTQTRGQETHQVEEAQDERLPRRISPGLAVEHTVLLLQDCGVGHLVETDEERPPFP